MLVYDHVSKPGGRDSELIEKHRGFALVWPPPTHAQQKRIRRTALLWRCGRIPRPNLEATCGV